MKFGLEMRRLPMGDGGLLAVHVLADLGGSTENSYLKKEILAFACFLGQQEPPHLSGHDIGRGPARAGLCPARDKNWDHDRAGWLPGGRGRFWPRKIASVLPMVKKKDRGRQGIHRSFRLFLWDLCG